ncbi:MAG: hypothetical protein U0798_12160 [Gemmataceae bacterium]
MAGRPYGRHVGTVRLARLHRSVKHGTGRADHQPTAGIFTLLIVRDGDDSLAGIRKIRVRISDQLHATSRAAPDGISVREVTALSNSSTASSP